METNKNKFKYLRYTTYYGTLPDSNASLTSLTGLSSSFSS